MNFKGRHILAMHRLIRPAKLLSKLVNVAITALLPDKTSPMPL